MSNKDQVQSFLGRLESSVSECGGLKALRGREQQCLGPYVQNKVWPGEDFVYLGHSSNLDHPLLGTELEFKRKTTIALLFEARGNGNYCVGLAEAMNFEGFVETLSRFERELLNQLHPETLIGPAFETSGLRLESSFTLWKAVQVQESERKILVGV